MAWIFCTSPQNSSRQLLHSAVFHCQQFLKQSHSKCSRMCRSSNCCQKSIYAFVLVSCVVTRITSFHHVFRQMYELVVLRFHVSAWCFVIQNVSDTCIHEIWLHCNRKDSMFWFQNWIPIFKRDASIDKPVCRNKTRASKRKRIA